MKVILPNKRRPQVPLDAIHGDPLDAVRSFSSANKVNLLLKGNPTFITSPSGDRLINNSGTEALSTAGTGDVLAGMIGALAAKGTDTFHAGAAAAWFHGRAGDLANDVSSLVSSEDVLGAIPKKPLQKFSSPRKSSLRPSRGSIQTALPPFFTKHDCLRRVIAEHILALFNLTNDVRYFQEHCHCFNESRFVIYFWVISRNLKNYCYETSNHVMLRSLCAVPFLL